MTIEASRSAPKTNANTFSKSFLSGLSLRTPDGQPNEIDKGYGDIRWNEPDDAADRCYDFCVVLSAHAPIPFTDYLRGDLRWLAHAGGKFNFSRSFIIAGLAISPRNSIVPSKSSSFLFQGA